MAKRANTSTNGSRARNAATSASRDLAPHSPTHDEIAQRAFELFLARNQTHGSDVSDWLRAESELRGTHQACPQA